MALPSPPNRFRMCDHLSPGHPFVGWWVKVGNKTVSVGAGWRKRLFLIEYEPRFRDRLSPQYHRSKAYLRFQIPGPLARKRRYHRQLVLDAMWFR